jgi:Zn-dependent protease with chaperone function
MRRLPLWTALLASLLTAAQPAAASDPPHWPLALRAQMLRLTEVGWRLRLAATPRCPRLAADIGVSIDHAAAYPEPARAALMRELRLGDSPQVAAVASGSPAARAGIRPGDEVLSIQGADMSAALAQSADPALFADEVMDRLAALPPGRAATLVVQRGRAKLRKSVVPVAICASRTALETHGSLDAYSDSSDIAVTSALIDFTANDDELALILGHELAHVILHAAAGGQSADPLAAEQQADILGAGIARCAGYDMRRAAAFWPRFEAHDPLRRERLATHPSPGQRELRIAAAGFACPIADRH